MKKKEARTLFLIADRANEVRVGVEYLQRHIPLFALTPPHDARCSTYDAFGYQLTLLRSTLRALVADSQYMLDLFDGMYPAEKTDE